MTITTKAMKTIIIFIYNIIFRIYNKITFKDNSAHAAFTLTILVIYLILIFSFNSLINYFWKYNYIDELNSWLHLFISLPFYFIFGYFLKKILKNDKRAKCSDLL
jgi:hypothetical protein